MQLYNHGGLYEDSRFPIAMHRGILSLLGFVSLCLLFYVLRSSTSAATITRVEAKPVCRQRNTPLEQATPFNTVLSELKKCPKDHVKCSCCGWCGPKSDLRPFGAQKMKRSCPKCHAVERHRAACAKIALRLEHIDLSWSKPLKLLHFGPQLQMGRILDKTMGIFQVKVDKLAAGYEKAYDTVIEVDVEKIPFPDNFFDWVVILHVIEHVPHPERAVSEIQRVIKKGTGWALIEVPCWATPTIDCRNMTKVERTKVCWQFDHLWKFSCRDFAKILKKGGLVCQESRGERLLQFSCTK